jgi:hypothetical protein
MGRLLPCCFGEIQAPVRPLLQKDHDVDFHAKPVGSRAAAKKRITKTEPKTTGGGESGSLQWLSYSGQLAMQCLDKDIRSL